MATTKKRITISLDDQTYYLFKEFARIQKRPIATVITELLDQLTPPLQRTVSMLLAAENAPQQLLDELAFSFNQIAAELNEVAGEGNAQLDMLIAALQSEVNPPSSNTGVTTKLPKPNR